MRQLLLITYLRVTLSAVSFALSSTMYCDCSVSTFESECLKNDCDWVEGECIDRKCVTVNGQPCGEVQLPDCYTYKTQDSCTGYDQYYNYCMWNASSNLCKAVWFDQCSDATKYGEQYCDEWTCIWEAGSCVTAQCSKYTKQYDCTFYYSFSYDKLNLCNWANNQCSDANDLSLRNKDNCLEDTDWRAIWNPDSSECEWCTAQSQILVVAILIILQ